MDYRGDHSRGYRDQRRNKHDDDDVESDNDRSYKKRERSPRSYHDNDKSSKRGRYGGRYENSRGSYRNRRNDDDFRRSKDKFSRVKKRKEDELKREKYEKGKIEYEMDTDIKNMSEWNEISKPKNDFIVESKDNGEHGKDTAEQEQTDKKEDKQKKKVPLSLEELLKQKKKEEEEMMKPVFISKKDRIKKIMEEKQNDSHSSNNKSNESSKHSKDKQNKNGNIKDDEKMKKPERAPTKKSVSDKPLSRKELRRLEIEKKRKEREQLFKSHQEKKNDDESKDALLAKQIEEIKKDYLGKKERKKRKARSTERSKFNFEWDDSEDTSRDYDPLYDKKHEALLLFGRGKRAGIDIIEQKKKSNIYDHLSEQRKTEMASSGNTPLLSPALSMVSSSTASSDLTQPHKIKKPSRAALWKRKEFDLHSESKHWSEKQLGEMNERDWRIFKEDFGITVKGGKGKKLPSPIRSWEESNLPAPLLRTIKKVGYEKPTPVQMQCIPICLSNMDIIGLAETGSGKTAAFVIPMLCFISRLPKMTSFNSLNGPYALVLAPTRELVTQIEKETRKFAAPMGFKVKSFYGGVSIDQQAFGMRDGCEIIIATPGRLLDCLKNRYLVLAQCTYVVMDEADKMVDLGFEDDVNEILAAIPSSNIKPEEKEDESDDMVQTKEEEEQKDDTLYRQTLLFSATMPSALEKIATKYMRRKVIVNIGEVGKTVDRIKQNIIFVKGDFDKRNHVVKLLEKADPPIMVFLNTKRAVDSLSMYLSEMGFRVAGLHGSKNQQLREVAIEGFRRGKYDILVATDVAGRGIDIEGVTMVINYDTPKTISAYVHRIGRTGRAGREGISYTLLNMEEDTEILYDLRKKLEESNQFIPDEIMNHEAAFVKPNSILAEKAKQFSNQNTSNRKDNMVISRNHQ